MKRIAIIGAGGVGAAHLCAAVRVGCNVSWIVDADPRVLERLRTSWSNRWEDVAEEVPVQEGTLYVREVRCKIDSTVDLAIVAVPPAAQAEAVADAALAFPKAILLVEKPISLPDDVLEFLKGRIRMSAEWVYAKGILAGSPSPTEFGMSYPWTPKPSGWRISAFLDFMPHLAAIFVRRYGPPGSLTLLHEFEEECSFSRVICVGGIAFRFWGSHVHFLEQCGLHVADGGWRDRFPWQDDLFDRQLRQPKPGLGYEEILSVQRLMGQRQ